MVGLTICGQVPSQVVEHVAHAIALPTGNRRRVPAGSGSVGCAQSGEAGNPSAARLTLVVFQKASDWQAHSVRGFLSGAVKKKMGLRVVSTKLPDGERTYRIILKQLLTAPPRLLSSPAAFFSLPPSTKVSGCRRSAARMSLSVWR